ncbi:putative leader peptide [Pseudofrankia inefficax]|uniref:Uncharacterized protein n=1 Tax=Pseudofrankia inefficax (strain DSM 45817 / CECT 9037 / DDB 130130 / EuI1c) TaxID=298654 RepID=E3JCY8_PSEI1|nr:putative leader peptide [Pseudofrankia inefficax]ADP81127.1 hypothetical protein FraEuI1c_3105 [Pseudofrankia inefficax]
MPATPAPVVVAFRDRSVAMFSRRHIDLQRVTSSLCPGGQLTLVHTLSPSG